MMTMRRFGMLLALAAACGGEGSDVPDPVDGIARCQGTDEAFVRNASLAVLGRRPFSQDEVNVYAGLMAEVRLQAPPFGGGPDPREVVVRAMARRPEYVDRWSQVIMDALRVQRIDDQTMQSCYGAGVRAEDNGQLAASVRDNTPRAGGDGGGAFTMRDLLRSALRLDDLTPVLRAHLFAMLSRPIPAANVPRVQAELARRDDYGNMFDAAYLHRDIVCLGCHNSSGSVTFNVDPELNRHWAIPGLVEASLYGQSYGVEPERAHAVFRFDGFVADPFGGGGGERPWGWSGACGEFIPDALETDPAGVDAKFGEITGYTPTVYDLEAMLRRGVDKLAQDGLTVGVEGEVLDADTALAWLVAASVSEKVWREVVGSPLTIANYFPRNEVSRDLLWRLTVRLADSHFSLEDLLVEIALTPYFNPAPPAVGCGEAPYAIPNVYNPWVIGEGDPAMRLNSPADGVHPLSARTLWTAAYAALDWPTGVAPHVEFPEVPIEVYFCLQGGFSCAAVESYCQSTGDCCLAVDYCYDPSLEATANAEQAFQRGIGAFLKNGERGFAGLDFQARLVWEERFGACASPDGEADFIDGIVAGAQADAGATLRDVVQAIKDRLIGEPAIEDEVERAPIEALFDATLDTPAGGITGLEAGARRLCGALIASPQFVLGGLPPGDRNPAPRLTPSDARFDAICEDVRGRVAGVAIECNPRP